MNGGPSLGAKALAGLCHRLAISTGVGIDLIKAWRREAANTRGPAAGHYTRIAGALESGESLTDALRLTPGAFPPLFVEMVGVGEVSGSLPEVFQRLADHYQHRHSMAREFRGRLAWPLIELIGALGIIGLLIYVLGVIGATDLRGKPVDILGLGLVGTQGLVVYVAFLATLALAVGLVVALVRRGWAPFAPLEGALMRSPLVGDALQKVCLARLAWALHLTLNVAMDLRQLVPLALRASGSSYYTVHTQQIVEDIQRGRPLHEAFARSRAFPTTFLEALEVAEEGGQVVESMSRLSRVYQAEADSAVETLSKVVSFVIWGGVMVGITLLIFRLFNTFYLGPIRDAMEL